MFFTQKDYNNIYQWLLRNSITDSLMQNALPIKGNEQVVIVLNGKNVKVTIDDLAKELNLVNAPDIINCTEKYGADTLEKAIGCIPLQSRKLGQIVTFCDEHGVWQLYQFKGVDINQWNTPSLWQGVFAASGDDSDEPWSASAIRVNATDEPTASVELVGHYFKFTFGLPKGDKGDKGDAGDKGDKGDKGDNGQDGQDGLDGKDAVVTEKHVFIFKESNTTPPTPSGGSWNTDTDIVTPPTGWTLTDLYNGIPIWMSYGIINRDTNIETQWSTPIRITGLDGVNGVDGKSIEFIYKLSPTAPATPPSSNEDMYIPEGWTDHPTGIDSLHPIEWVSIRTKNTNWSDFSTPAVFSKWGVDGRDGDGIEYIYTLTSTFTKPTIASYDNASAAALQNEYLPPKGSNLNPWTDNPSDISEDWKYLWVSVRKFSRDTQRWGVFSLPTLFAKYGEKGQDGEDGKDGKDGLDGQNGLNGRDGIQGPVIYPAGKYNTGVLYESTDTKTPYVLDPLDNRYYMLQPNKVWVGINQGGLYPSLHYAVLGNQYWEPFEGFEALYARIGIIDNGLIGSAVFNGNYMFSQQGSSNNYEDFNPLSPYAEYNTFIPNFCLDFLTGEAWFSRGAIHLLPDGLVVVNNLNHMGITHHGAINITPSNISKYGATGNAETGYTLNFLNLADCIILKNFGDISVDVVFPIFTKDAILNRDGAIISTYKNFGGLSNLGNYALIITFNSRSVRYGWADGNKSSYTLLATNKIALFQCVPYSPDVADEVGKWMRGKYQLEGVYEFI